MKILKQIFFILSLLILLLTGGAIYASSENRIDLIQEGRELQQKRSEVRLNLLRENAELRELHNRIVKLQKTLVRKLDSQPEMQPIVERIKTINDQLRQANFQ